MDETETTETLAVHKKQRSSAKGSITRIINKIDKTMNNKDDPTDILSQLQQACEAFQVAHDKVCNAQMMEEEEVDLNKTYFEKVTSDVEEVKY